MCKNVETGHALSLRIKTHDLSALKKRRNSKNQFTTSSP